MLTKRTRTYRRAAARRARKLMRGGVAAGFVAWSACSDAHGPSAVPADASAATAGTRATHGDAGFVAVPPPRDGGSTTTTAPDLSADSVDAIGVARNVLYSWTSEKQVAELRADPVLLTRSESSTGARTNLSTALASLADGGDPLAEVLSSVRFQKGRYAWSNAWATLRGWPDESYGNELIRIVLEPDAWIATLRRGQLEVVDLSNTPVDVATAVATPERIAAVYFINNGDGGPQACGSFAGGCGTGAYREYFVNNEQMVQEWSLGTQQILDELERSIAVVQALRAQVADGRLSSPDACELTRAALCDWTGLGSSPGPYGRYLGTLALTSAFYEPSTDNMDALLMALQDSLFTPDPLIHKP